MIHFIFSRLTVSNRATIITPFLILLRDYAKEKNCTDILKPGILHAFLFTQISQYLSPPFFRAVVPFSFIQSTRRLKML